MSYYGALAANKRFTPVDVHILIGQSNMDGRGAMASLPSGYTGAKTNVQMYNGSAFVSLDSTANNNQYPVLSNQYGPEFTYLLDYANQTGRDQYCFKLSLGSTGLYPGSSAVTADNPTAKDWSPSTGGLYTDLINLITSGTAALRASGKIPVIKSILWMQGERDAGNATWAAAYGTNLTDLFFTNLIPFLQTINATVNSATIPIILPRIANSSGASDLATVRAAQLAFTVTYSNAKTFDTDFYPLNVDNIHYGNLGFLWLGHNALSKLNLTYAYNEDFMAANPASITITDAADGVTITNGAPSLIFANAHSGTVAIFANKAETAFGLINSSGIVATSCFMTWNGTGIPVSAHIFSLYKDTTNFVRIQSRNSSVGADYRLIIQIAGVNVYDVNTAIGLSSLVKITYDYSTNAVKFWVLTKTSTTNLWVQMGTTQTAVLANAGTQLKTLITCTDAAADSGGTAGVYRKISMNNADYSTAFP